MVRFLSARTYCALVFHFQSYHLQPQRLHHFHRNQNSSCCHSFLETKFKVHDTSRPVDPQMYVCMSVRVYVHLYVYASLNIYVCMSVCVCMYVCGAHFAVSCMNLRGHLTRYILTMAFKSTTKVVINEPK